LSGSASQAGPRSSRSAPSSAWSASSAATSAEHGDVDVERLEQLGRHEAEQVRPGGVAQLWHPRERRLGAGGAADDVVGFEDHHPEPGAGEQDGGDQAVVAGSDDHYVSALRQIRHSSQH
jgi:hypothetical protein